MFRFVFIFIDDDSFSQWWKCGSARCCLASSSARKLRWTIVNIVIVSSSLSSLYHCISSSSCGLIRCSEHGRERELKWKLFATQSSRSGAFIFHCCHHVRINIICIILWCWSLSFASYYDDHHDPYLLNCRREQRCCADRARVRKHPNCQWWWFLDVFASLDLKLSGIILFS